MVGTPPIKAMERSTNSLTTAHNGKTRIRMGTATTPLQHSTLIPVHSCLEIQPWTDWVAQMSMVMATPMKTIGPRATKSNGSMQTVMGSVTITCTTSHRINFTSTNGDAFPTDSTQWNDTDGDGYGDNYEDVSWNQYRAPEWPGVIISGAQNIDVFPLDRT